MKTQSSRKRKLLSSVAMLLVALVALGSATYAWFVNSSTAKVSGLEVTVNADDGLLLSSDYGTEGANAKWGSIVDIAFGNKSLLPVSGNYAIDSAGINFFSAELSADKDGNGTISSNANTTKLTKETAVAGHYIEVKVWAKLASADGNATTLKATNNVSKVTTDTQSENLVKLQNMVRVAYADDANLIKGVTTTNSSNRTAFAFKAAVTDKDATSFIADSTVAGAQGDDGYLNSVTATPNATPVELTDSLSTSPKLITLYIWVEGQDTDCVPNNGGAQGKFDFTFELTD